MAVVGAVAVPGGAVREEGMNEYLLAGGKWWRFLACGCCVAKVSA